MKVVFHYDAGPALRQRLAALTGEGLSVFHCPEDDDARFSELMGDTGVVFPPAQNLDFLIAVEFVAGNDFLRIHQTLL